MKNRGRRADSSDKREKFLTGNIRRNLIVLAVPLLLGNMMQQCYHIADSWIIGRYLGIDAFAAVGVAGTVMNFMIFILDGFFTGVSVVFSALFGAGEQKRFREELFTAAILGGGITILLSILSLVVMKPLLRLIQTPEGLIPYTVEYLTIIAAGMIVTCFYQLLIAVLRSVGDMGAGLLFLAVSVMGNVVLDYILVAVWSMGLVGAAAATVAAQVMAAAGCLFYLCRYYGDLICRKGDMGINQDLMKRTFRFGFASALQESNLYLGKILVQGAVNLLGTSGIAAFTAASRIEGFANSFGDSGALAVSVAVSQNHGAGNRERVKEILKQGVIIHVVLGIVIPAIMFLGAEPGIRGFLSESQTGTIQEGSGYLRMVSVFYILCFVGSGLVGYFRGIGKIHVPVIGTTLNIGVRVLLAWKMIRKFGLTGLAFATGIGWMMVVGYQLWNLFRISNKGQRL